MMDDCEAAMGPMDSNGPCVRVEWNVLVFGVGAGADGGESSRRGEIV